jgi:hypothetical protein
VIFLDLRGVGTALLLLVLSQVAASCSMCGNRVAKSIASPSGSFVAVLFERDCGATTRVSSQVSVFSAKRELSNEAGNTFISDAPVRAVALLWQSDTSLRITYPRNSHAFKQQQSVEGVTIRYVVR